MKLRNPMKRPISAAAAYRREGNAERAIEILGDVLANSPDHAQANVEMARALRVLGDPAEAEVFYRAAIAEVLDYVAICELAQVVVEQGRIEEAEELIDAAIAMANGQPRLDPGEALLVRASIAIGQGRLAAAHEALDQIHRKRASKTTRAYVETLRARIDELDRA
jgi:tetratricopeptide (TPR) repeat protein